jgi:deoxycytidine triphosphate deaminase
LRFVRIRKGDPIAQILFVRMSQETERPYTGKYQNQERGPQKARRETVEA